MDQPLPLTERKVVRRGLLAGLAGLGAAAAMKLTGRSAEATDGQFILIGDEVQTAQTETRLNASPAFNNSVFSVLNGGSLPGLKGAITAVTTGSSAHGVFGINHTAGGFGVRGSSDSGTGVVGQSTTGVGVRGTANTDGGTAVQGETTAVNGISMRGVHAANGTGVKGVSNTDGVLTGDGTGSGFGVQGKSTGGAGVRGDSVNAPGVEGVSTNSLGLRGISTNSTGIVGISTIGHGLYGSTSGAASAGFVGENLGGGLAGYFAGNVFVTGALQVVGAKNAVIKMQDGTLGSVYCQESPEPYFEDFGKAQLAGGAVNVALEREFAQLVAGAEYLVFLTPEGDTRGLYVSRKGPAGFEVREVQGGTGNVPFTYRIVTKRKDVEGKRFARVVDSVGPNLAASRAAMGLAGTPPLNTAPPHNPMPSQQNPLTPPAYAPQPNPPSPNPTQPSPNAPNPTTNGLIQPGSSTAP